MKRKLFAVSMAAGMVACGSSDKKEETTKKEETKKDDKETKKLEGTLKVVTTGDAYQPLFDKFTEEVGPKVEFISMSSGEVLSKLKAEGGTPAADLWFGGGIDAFMDAKDNDLLEKVDFDAADELAPEFKDSDNYWFSKGVTVVGFIVNNDILKEKGLEAPKSWDDLTKEEYQGEVLMSNPAISGTNYAVVNALLQTKGDEEGWKYFEALNKNVDYYSKRGSDPSTKTAAGEVGIGITYINGTLDELKEHYQRIITLLGEDAEREGLLKTPERVAKAMLSLTKGYFMDPHEVLRSAKFKEEYSQMVIVKDIDFFSLCEHHMLPFYGKAHVAYIPNGYITGLSKIARVVDIFSHRLQVQERMTLQIKECIQETLNPLGVMVVVEAKHMCMQMRGVEKQNSITTTSDFTGAFNQAKTREEFMNLIRQNSFT